MALATRISRLESFYLPPASPSGQERTALFACRVRHTPARPPFRWSDESYTRIDEDSDDPIGPRTNFGADHLADLTAQGVVLYVAWRLDAYGWADDLPEGVGDVFDPRYLEMPDYGYADIFPWSSWRPGQALEAVRAGLADGSLAPIKQLWCDE